MALIACQNAAFSYEGHTVVEGLDFEVNPGDYLCIVGENGSGKSTLVKGLLRLKTPNAGQVVVSDALQSGGIGYLPQQTAPQKDFPASVWEVVLSGLQNQKRLFYTAAHRAAATDALAQLGITDLKTRCYRELSGGQQQRVLLARALCAGQKLLILDEPVAGLDPVVTGELYGLIGDLNRQQGITIVMVSHDVETALHHASHMLHLAHRQLYFGPAAGYAQSPAGALFVKGGNTPC